MALFRNSLLVAAAHASASTTRRQLWPSPDADCSTFPSESYPDCASIDTQHDHSASECELKSCKWCVFDEDTGDGPDGGGTCVGNPGYTQYGSGSGSGSYFTKEPGYSDGYSSGSGYGDGSYHDYDHNYPHDSPGPYGDGYGSGSGYGSSHYPHHSPYPNGDYPHGSPGPDTVYCPPEEADCPNLDLSKCADSTDDIWDQCPCFCDAVSHAGAGYGSGSGNPGEFQEQWEPYVPHLGDLASVVLYELRGRLLRRRPVAVARCCGDVGGGEGS